MGRSARGELVFGVPLGGSDEGWLLDEPSDEWGSISLEAEHLPWLTAEQVEEFDEYSYHEILELGLKHLESVTDGCLGRSLAEGLEVHQHGYDLRSFALTLETPTFSVSWGDFTDVDPGELARVGNDENLRAQFRLAFEALNLKPTHVEPRWFLTAEYF